MRMVRSTTTEAAMRLCGAATACTAGTACTVGAIWAVAFPYGAGANGPQPPCGLHAPHGPQAQCVARTASVVPGHLMGCGHPTGCAQPPWAATAPLRPRHELSQPNGLRAKERAAAAHDPKAPHAAPWAAGTQWAVAIAWDAATPCCRSVVRGHVMGCGRRMGVRPPDDLKAPHGLRPPQGLRATHGLRPPRGIAVHRMHGCHLMGCGHATRWAAGSPRMCCCDTGTKPGEVDSYDSCRNEFYAPVCQVRPESACMPPRKPGSCRSVVAPRHTSFNHARGPAKHPASIPRFVAWRALSVEIVALPITAFWEKCGTCRAKSAIAGRIWATVGRT